MATWEAIEIQSSVSEPALCGDLVLPVINQDYIEHGLDSRLLRSSPVLPRGAFLVLFYNSFNILQG